MTATDQIHAATPRSDSEQPVRREPDAVDRTRRMVAAAEERLLFAVAR
jgi:hypothetical protein